MASKRVFLVDGYQAKPPSERGEQRGLQVQPQSGTPSTPTAQSLPKTTSVVQKPKK